MEIAIQHIPERLWTPVRTKAKCEKKLAEYCKANTIDHYLPIVPSVKRYQRKTVTFHVPMFPGYVFCNLDYTAYKLLLKSHCVFFKIDINDCMEKLLIDELNNLKIVESSESQKELLIKPEIIEGEKVKIISGPLTGASGVFNKRNNKHMVTVNIVILGQSVTIEVDIGDIELLSD